MTTLSELKRGAKYSHLPPESEPNYWAKGDKKVHTVKELIQQKGRIIIHTEERQTFVYYTDCEVNTHA